MLIRIFMTEKLNFEERAYYAPAFDSTFGSLRCFELRPAGFQKTTRSICVKIWLVRVLNFHTSIF